MIEVYFVFCVSFIVFFILDVSFYLFGCSDLNVWLNGCVIFFVFFEMVGCVKNCFNCWYFVFLILLYRKIFSILFLKKLFGLSGGRSLYIKRCFCCLDFFIYIFSNLMFLSFFCFWWIVFKLDCVIFISCLCVDFLFYRWFCLSFFYNVI